MFWQFIIGGLALGFFSSMHCVGMCGPLALALPVHHLSPLNRFFALLLHQLGRVVTYAALGLLFGFAGRHIYIAGFQQWFSMGMGLLILVLLILFYFYRKNIQPAFMRKFYTGVQRLIIGVLQSKKHTASYLLLGMANGLLPCGMVYVALAATLTSSTINQSVLFMAMFGLGTLPAMMAISYLGTSLSLNVRSTMRKAVPYGIALMAIVLILRGMNLGVPFISPVLQSAPGVAVECHN